MIIFKDRITGDELLSDTYAMKLIDDLYYEVDGKITTEKTEVSDDMFGGNASAEGGGDDGAEDGSATGCNIVLANRLGTTPFDKKSYATYIKGYCKALLEKLDEDAPERAAVFRKGMQDVIKKVILPNFKNWEFYTGESLNPEGMVVLLDYREDGETPYMIFFKDGMIEEKV